MKKAREVADRVLAEWLAGLRPHTRGVIVSRLFDDFAKAGFVILPRDAMVQHYESNSGGGD